MTIFNNVKKGFSFYWKAFKLFFQKSSGLANCKPVLAYPDAGIDFSPNPRRYAGLSPNERLNEIKQNLAYVWADGYESKTWKKRQCNYIGIRLTPSLILHEMIGTGRGYDLTNAKKLASICKARFFNHRRIQRSSVLLGQVVRNAFDRRRFSFGKSTDVGIYEGHETSRDRTLHFM